MSGTRHEPMIVAHRDRRVVRTRAAVVDALTELARDREVREISVKELAHHAQVGRSTFYEHFESMEDLLCWLVDELVEEVRDADGVFQLDVLLAFVGGMPEVSRAFLQIESCATRCQTALTECLWGHDRSARRFAAAGIMALLADWLHDDDRQPLAHLIEDTCALVETLLGPVTPTPSSSITSATPAGSSLVRRRPVGVEA